MLVKTCILVNISDDKYDKWDEEEEWLKDSNSDIKSSDGDKINAGLVVLLGKNSYHVRDFVFYSEDIRSVYTTEDEQWNSINLPHGEFTVNISAEVLYDMMYSDYTESEETEYCCKYNDVDDYIKDEYSNVNLSKKDKDLIIKTFNDARLESEDANEESE